MTFWIVQTLNGLSFGMLLFLIAVGLSLIYGLMRLLNMAHGSFYLLGGYIGLTVIRYTHNFPLALAAGVLAGVLFGLVVQRFFLQRLQHEELSQALITFGILLIISDLALWIWGGIPQTLPKPSWLKGSIEVRGIMFPSYRFFLIGIGLVIAAGLWLLQRRTKVGAIIRASVDDPEMVEGLGINRTVVYTAMFALGAFLATLAGVLGGPLIGVYPGVDFEVLILAFVVVIVGGLGSLEGAFIGAVIVGLIDNFGKALFPELALFTIFAPIVIILALKPTGLLGKA